jgi:hypothetical protein
MPVSAKRFSSKNGQRDSFHADLGAGDLAPLWELGDILTHEPKAA